MELTNDRYQLFYRNEAGKPEGSVVLDVVKTPDKPKEGPFPNKKGLLFLGPEEGKGEATGHKVLGMVVFENEENLKQAQMALELLQAAIFRELDEQTTGGD